MGDIIITKLRAYFFRRGHHREVKMEKLWFINMEKDKE